MPVVEFHVLARTHKLICYCIWNTKSQGLATWLQTGDKKAFSQIKYALIQVKTKGKKRESKRKPANGQDVSHNRSQPVPLSSSLRERRFALKYKWRNADSIALKTISVLTIVLTIIKCNKLKCTV